MAASGARAARWPRPSLGTTSLAIALVLLALLLAAPEAIPWPRARALAALVAFFFGIGELARRALFPRLALDALRSALVAVSLGSATLSLLVGGAWLAGNRLSTAERALPFLVAALGIAAWRRRRAAADGSGERPFPTRAALLLMALAAPLLWFHDPLLSVDDSLDHVGSLRKRIDLDAVFPSSTFYAASNENGPDARKGLFHGVLALVAASTRTPLLPFWDALPFAGTAWLLLSILAAGRTLFAGEFRPLAAALLFATIWEGGLGGDGLSRLSHPSRMVLAPYWTICALLLDTGLPAPIGLLFLLGFGLAAIHASAPIFLGLGVAFLLLFLWAAGEGEARRSLRPIARGGTALLAGAAPYLAYRSLASMPLLDTIHTEPQGLLYWTRSLFTVNPVWTVQAWGALGLLAIPAVLVLLGRARRETPFAFLASGVLGAVAVLANPLATVPLQRVLGYLVVRLAWFTPHVFVLAHAIDAARGRLRRAAVGRAPLVAAGVAAFLVVIGAHLVGAARALPGWCAGGPPDAGLRAQAGAFEAVERAIGEPAVILADPATGYAIPALTRHWTVSAMPQHTPPNDPDARDRLRDTRRILSPYVNAADTVALLRRYGAEWILLNDAPAAALSRYAFHPNDATAAAARAKIASGADLFTPVLSSGGLTLYRLTDAALTGPLPDAAAATRPLPAVAGQGKPLGDWEEGAFRLHEAAVLTDSVEKGGDLAIASVWERRREVPDANRYLIVRLARKDAGSVLDRTLFARAARRLADAAHGEPTRARLGFAPGDGFLPPDEWPLATPLRDVSELPIPSDLAPGDYVVKLRLVEETFYPNLHPADFFSLEGSYDGVPIGTVRVIRHNEEITS